LDHFQSAEALKAWLLGYVPIVGGGSLWRFFVFLMMLQFVRSCIEQLAQSEAANEDNRALQQFVADAVKKQ
jgi:hypothetical protein